MGIFFFLLYACKKDPPVVTGLQITSVKIGSITLDMKAGAINTNIPVDQSIVVAFTEELDMSTVSKSFFLLKDNDTIPVSFTFFDQSKTISAKPAFNLDSKKSYTLIITFRNKITYRNVI